MNEDHTTPRRQPSRREFLALGAGAFVVASLPFALARRQTLTRRTLPVMGTVAEIAVVHRDERYAQQAIDAAFGELQRVERTMSRFRGDSEIGRANLMAGTQPVLLSAATAAVLAEALRWADATDGRFDPALGRAVAFWDVAGRQAPPADTELRRFAGQRLHRHVELDARGDASRLRFHERAVALDLGGIAKGYAVDRAVQALREWGVQHALVNAGGDLYALGRSPEGDAWQVGIQSPFEPTRLIATLPLEGAAVATSGDYEQYFEHQGRRYHHLLDPATGAPHEARARTLTVAAASCMTADAAATAAFGCTTDDAARLLRAAPDAKIVHLA
jgi:FAD:protein FMN transferase